MKILILCTGNSCRSQMAEGWLSSFDPTLQVFSAGTHPGPQVHPFAVKAMAELGIDISHHYPKNVDQFVSQSFDFVVTVCNNAKETCPLFIGKVGRRLHFDFEDPAEARGTDDEVFNVFRDIRDQIKEEFYQLYLHSLTQE